MTRFETSRSTIIPTALAALVLFSSCGIGSRTTTTPTSSLDDGERSQGVSVSISSNVHEAALARAKQSVRDGKYDVAAGQFERLANTVEAGSDLRAEALLDLGALYRNVLNPARNPKLASKYYQRLIDEFPDSPLRVSAEQEIDRLRAP